MHRIVVLGAGYAGLPAVNRIARQTHRDEAELVLVSTRDRFVERPRLHQLAAGQPRPDLPLTGFLAPGVRLRVGRVDRLADHALAFADTAELPYDTLLYGPGSTIDVTSVPGVAEHAHTLAGPESALAIATALRAGERARVVVVGGGLTGLELAAEVAESFPHTEVTLVTAGEPGGWLSPRAQAYVTDALDALGVRRVANTRVASVADGRLDSGLEFDLCLWAGGFTVPPLATDAGIEVDGRGRVITDPTLRSLSHPDVFAIGDAAAIPGPWGDALAMGCRTGGFTGPSAADAVVARLRGLPARPFRFRYFHECLSLGRRHAVIQFLDRDGRVRDRTLRGRAATAYKNVVLDAGRWASRNPGPFLRPRRRVATRGEIGRISAAHTDSSS
jgi:NADH:ubiquinone reductase (H+-translocating)